MVVPHYKCFGDDDDDMIMMMIAEVVTMGNTSSQPCTYLYPGCTISRTHRYMFTCYLKWFAALPISGTEYPVAIT